MCSEIIFFVVASLQIYLHTLKYLISIYISATQFDGGFVMHLYELIVDFEPIERG